MAQAQLVNVSIFCRTTNQSLLRLRIMQIGQPGRSIEQFYHDVASAKKQGTQGITLKSTYLGRSKDSLDKVELSVALDKAVPLLEVSFAPSQLRPQKAGKKSTRMFFMS